MKALIMRVVPAVSGAPGRILRFLARLAGAKAVFAVLAAACVFLAGYDTLLWNKIEGVRDGNLDVLKRVYLKTVELSDEAGRLDIAIAVKSAEKLFQGNIGIFESLAAKLPREADIGGGDREGMLFYVRDLDGIASPEELAALIAWESQGADWHRIGEGRDSLSLSPEMAGSGLSLVHAGVYNIGGSKAVAFLLDSGSARVRIVHYPPGLESVETKWASYGLRGLAEGWQIAVESNVGKPYDEEKRWEDFLFYAENIGMDWGYVSIDETYYAP
jgi:hypothetical protein